MPDHPKVTMNSATLMVPRAALQDIGWQEGDAVYYEVLSPTSLRIMNWHDRSREVIIVDVQGVPID